MVRYKYSQNGYADSPKFALNLIDLTIEYIYHPQSDHNRFQTGGDRTLHRLTPILHRYVKRKRGLQRLKVAFGTRFYSFNSFNSFSQESVFIGRGGVGPLVFTLTREIA